MLYRAIAVILLVVAACGGTSTTTTTSSAATTTSSAAITTIATPTASIPGRDARWAADLAAMVEGLERIHPNPYWRVGEATFKADVADVAARIPALDDDQATLEVVRLAAQIDGHTSVFVGLLGWDLGRIQFYAFDDGIGVVGSDDASLIGGRLVAIGATPADVALNRAAVLASYDNPMTRAFTTPFFLAVPRLLSALGITDDPTAATYTIETVAGTTVQVTPETGDFGDYRAWFGDPVIGLPQSGRSSYLERRTTPFWWHSLDDGTVYLQYNEVTSGLSTIAQEVAAALDASGGSRLVVDMRHNGGGDNQTYGPLLSMLADRYADTCGLFVIIGRATFSAAVNFATEVEHQTEAVFVGEPTGGSPKLYGDVVIVTLPNSGIRFQVSHRYWEFGDPDDDRIWIEPAIAVPPTLADWNAGHDAALEAVLAAPLCGPTVEM